MSANRWSPVAHTASLAGLLLLAACTAQPVGNGAQSHDASVPNRSTAAPVLAPAAHAPGSATSPGLPTADPSTDAAGGLAASGSGFWLVSATPQPSSVRAVDYRFQVLAPDGSAVTSFLGGDDTARVYAVRADLTGLRRAVPTNLGEGVWAAALGELDPGQWRIYVQFTPNSNPGPSGRPPDLLLSRTLLVPGVPETSPLDPPSDTASVDGLTVTLTGDPVVGRPTVLRLAVSHKMVQGHHPVRTTLVPVDYLEPVDGAFAQVAAVHADDLALAAFTPLDPATAPTGGPGLTFRGVFTQGGSWRLFVRFHTGGQEHVATFTVPVRG